MSTAAGTLTREQWATLLDEVEPATFHELVSAINDADMIDADAEATVEAAISDDGPLTTDEEASGMFDVFVLADDSDPAEGVEEEADVGDETPGFEAGGSPDDGVNSWRNTDFTTTNAGVYPQPHHEREQWMGRLAGEKTTFSPWADSDHPEADPEDDARFKWSLEENHTDGDTVAMGEADPRLDGRVFIQRDEDRFAFVDGDDVRCPETGEVHPAFTAMLEHLGMTYADVSTSGSGVHAYYTGDIPLDGHGQASFDIDDEPFGANDTPPSIEFYANKHLCITTGEQVEGTPTAAVEWDADALRPILEAAGFEDEEEVSHDTDQESPELDGYDPDATAADETASDVRDVLSAVDDLQPRDLPLRSRQVGKDSDEWEKWDPSSYRSSDGNDSLHRPAGEPVFHDFKKGKSFGVLSLFAAEQGIINDPWDRLAGEDWWEAVDTAREKGAPIPEFTTASEGEAVASLGVSKLNALDPEDRRRAARKRGHDIPTTRDARERLRSAIFREMRNGNTTVLDAPTALGKSYTVATEPWLRRQSVTGDAPVIHLHATTDARDEAAAETADVMSTGEVLLGRKEASPVARGDHDPQPDDEDPEIVVTVDGQPASEWFDAMCDEKGLAFSTALAIARRRNDQDLDELPPFGEEDPAVAQWDGVPRDGDGDPAADVVHATHQFAHVPSIRANTNIVLDEQPDYREDLSQDRIRRMINAYLKEIGAPVTNFEDFVRLAEYDDVGGDAAAERDALDEMLSADGDTLPTEWYVENPDAHALAAGIARGLWNALTFEEADANGRRSTKVYHEPPRFDADQADYSAGTWLSVVVDDDHTVRRVRSTPDFREARAVVGLDAHPSMPLWELNGAPGMTHDSVLDSTERRLWRRFERGLTVVQVGDATRPRSGDRALEWMNDDRVRAVLQRLREHYGDGFKTALSTVQTERQVRELLDEVAEGCSIDEENTMHYGEEKSRNDFATEEAGYVYGCMDPGDEMILDTLAELNLDATPSTAETEDGEIVREKGRTFDGDDDEKAAAVLASVRENHVAQAAGRYARDADGDRGATVYVHTDAAPTGFVDVETPGVEWLATDLQRSIIDTLTEREEATAREIADAVDCSKEHVRETLKKLEDRELIERKAGEGYNGADVFADEGATHDITETDSTANDRLWGSNRWSLAIEFRHAGDRPTIDTSAASNATPDAVSAADTPPDPGLSDGGDWR